MVSSMIHPIPRSLNLYRRCSTVLPFFSASGAGQPVSLVKPYTLSSCTLNFPNLHLSIHFTLSSA